MKKILLFFIVCFFISNCCTLPSKEEIKEEQQEYTEKVEEQKVIIKNVRRAIKEEKCNSETLEDINKVEAISEELKEKNKQCIENQLTCTNELKEEKEGFWYWIGAALLLGFILDNLLRFTIRILIKTIRG